MEATTIQKYLHTSPRKLRLVTDMVRQMEPARALDVLRMTPKMAARDLAKALETVLANAKQQGMEEAKIGFKKIEVNESMKMRRFRAGTRGRAKPYKKRMAHIKIVLSDEIEKTQIKPEKKQTMKELPVKTEKIKKEEGGKQTEVVVDDLAEKAKK